MQLDKTTGNKTAGTLANNITVKNTGQTQANSQINLQSKSIDAQSARSLASLIASSGLPNDKLSASVLSFARFFSLALKPEQLAAIRRQAMTAQNTVSKNMQQTAQTANQANLISARNGSALFQLGREAFALASAAAESKGVELAAKGLEAYAEAVDPDQHKQQNGKEREKERQKKEQNEKEKTGEINTDSIKKLALESAETNPVLQIMNKLPSKDGRRWIVLPFDFCQDEREYRVSMRVLLERENAVFMAVTISNEQAFLRNGAMSSEQVTGNCRQKIESFAFEFSNNKANKIIYYKSDISAGKQDAIKKELASIFGINIENVFVKNIENGDMPIPEADYGEELLRFIDEAV